MQEKRIFNYPGALFFTVTRVASKVVKTSHFAGAASSAPLDRSREEMKEEMKVLLQDALRSIGRTHDDTLPLVSSPPLLPVIDAAATRKRTSKEL